MYICNWASVQKQAIILFSDLKLDKFQLNETEVKLLRDFEATEGLYYLCTKLLGFNDSVITLID